jgi:hypothetical protein
MTKKAIYNIHGEKKNAYRILGGKPEWEEGVDGEQQ